MWRNGIRMVQDAEGRNVHVVTQFLNFSDAGYDSGIREPYDPVTFIGGAAGPSYALWQAIPNLP